MSKNTLKYFTINVYDFDVEYSKPNEKGEIKGAKVQVPYIGTVVVPAKNVWVPEQETKTFGGKGSFKGHKEYKNCVLTIRTGEMANGNKFTYPVLTKTKNGKVNRFDMTGDQLQDKIEKLSQGITTKDGKTIKQNYAMVIKEYDPESKKVVNSRNIWKETNNLSAKDAEALSKVKAIDNSDELDKVLAELDKTNDTEWMKTFDEVNEELAASIEETKSLSQAQ